MAGGVRGDVSLALRRNLHRLLNRLGDLRPRPLCVGFRRERKPDQRPPMCAVEDAEAVPEPLIPAVNDHRLTSPTLQFV